MPRCIVPRDTPTCFAARAMARSAERSGSPWATAFLPGAVCPCACRSRACSRSMRSVVVPSATRYMAFRWGCNGVRDGVDGAGRQNGGGTPIVLRLQRGSGLADGAAFAARAPPGSAPLLASGAAGASFAAPTRLSASRTAHTACGPGSSRRAPRPRTGTMPAAHPAGPARHAGRLRQSGRVGAYGRAVAWLASLESAATAYGRQGKAAGPVPPRGRRADHPRPDRNGNFRIDPEIRFPGHATEASGG